MATIEPSFLIGSSSFLQVTHKSSDELEYRQDVTTDYGVTSSCVSEKLNYVVTSTFIFDCIFFLAGDKDNHKILNNSKLGQFRPRTGK